MRRWERLAILSAVVLSQAGCPIPMWPDLPAKGTCRNFAITSWGGGAPWSDLDWKTVKHIDEPMLPMWGWKGDWSNRDDVCGEKGLGMVQARIDKARADCPTCTVWLNWSTDELEGLSAHACGQPLGLTADTVSIDSYGGVWDFPSHLLPILEMIHRDLAPGQQMGLVPEAHYYPAGGIDWEPIDYVMLGSLYLDFAFRHDRIFALAPFTWRSGPDMLGMEGNPQIAAFYSAITAEYPRCPP